jgi:carboxymethylenebutenolidase
MATGTADRSITTRNVRYGNDVEAFLAVPDAAGKHPSMILLHERYGLVQHTLDLAARFARDGYVCLAPNLYSRFPDQERLARGEIQVPLPDPQVLDDMNASIAHLQDVPQADLGRLAVMGVCLSGRWPIVAAANRSDVGAAVVFYGACQPAGWEVNANQPEGLDAMIARVQCPVLGVFGEGDHVIPLEYVLRFRNELERHRKTYLMQIVANVPHGWLNDTMPGRYRHEEAEASWRLLLAFLDRTWSGGYPADRVQWSFESDVAIDYDPSKNSRQA